MALNFPNNPTAGDTYAAGDIVYTYTGVVWTSRATTNFNAVYANDYATYANLVWTVQDEGSNVYTAPRFINFTGSGVSVSNSNANVTVTISGGGGGGDPTNFVTIVADYTMSTSNEVVVNLASSPVTVTLPNASTVKSYYFQNMGTSTMTLQTVSSQLINSDTSLVLEFTGSSCRLLSNSSAYLIF